MYRSRRITTAFLTVFLVFTACNGFFGTLGCNARPKAEELFFYRFGTIEADVTLECNGSVSSFRYVGQKNECRAEFTSPEELQGFTLELKEEGGRVTIGDLTADAPDALCTVPNIMRSVFALSPEDVTAIETAPHPEKAEETVTRVTAGEITVTLNGESIPIYAEGIFRGIQFTAKIANFTVNRGKTDENG